MKIIKKIFKYLALSVIAIIIAISIWLFIPNSNSEFTGSPRESTQYWDLKTGSKIAYSYIK